MSQRFGNGGKNLIKVVGVFFGILVNVSGNKGRSRNPLKDRVIYTKRIRDMLKTSKIQFRF